MYCTGCGANVVGAGKFCGACGQEIGGSSTGAAVQVKNVYRGKKKQIVGFALLTVGIILFVTGIATVSSGSSAGAFLPMFAVLFGMAGIVVMIIGRFEHWYHAE